MRENNVTANIKQGQLATAAGKSSPQRLLSKVQSGKGGQQTVFVGEDEAAQ